MNEVKMVILQHRLLLSFPVFEKVVSELVCKVFQFRSCSSSPITNKLSIWIGMFLFIAGHVESFKNLCKIWLV